MRTLIVAGYGVKLGVEKGLLVIRGKNGVEKVSLGDVDQVVIATSGVSISSRAVRALLRIGVDLVFLDSRGMPAARLWLPYLTKTTMTRRAQYEAYLNGRGLRIARVIVWSKLMNQAGYLKRLARLTGISELRDNAYSIEALAAKVNSVEGLLEEARSELRNIEAQAARIYWSSIKLALPSDIGFEGRDYDSDDPLNTALNYLYAVAYTETWRELVLAGLDPFAGYIHSDRSGKLSLVYDYIEMFRVSMVDSLLVKLYRTTTWRPKTEKGLMDAESRGRLLKEFYENMERRVKPKDLDRTMTLKQALRHYAYQLARTLREGGDYRGFIEKW